MSSPYNLVATAADLPASLLSDVLRAVERVRHPVKQEFFARFKDFERIKYLLHTLETGIRRKDEEYQRVCHELEQTKHELATSEDNLRICSQAKADLEVQVTASKDLHVRALMGQLCLIEAAEDMIEDTREELEHVRMLAESAQVDYEQKASEQAAELSATKLQLEETTAALRAAEEKNESLIAAIDEVESLCSV